MYPLIDLLYKYDWWTHIYRINWKNGSVHPIYIIRRVKCLLRLIFSYRIMKNFGGLWWIGDKLYLVYNILLNETIMHLIIE